MVVMMMMMPVPVVLTQFQAELGSGPHWEVAGAGVRQPRLPGVRLRLGLHGLPRPGAVARQQRRPTEGLPGRVTRRRQAAGRRTDGLVKCVGWA